MLITSVINTYYMEDTSTLFEYQNFLRFHFISDYQIRYLHCKERM